MCVCVHGHSNFRLCTDKDPSVGIEGLSLSPGCIPVVFAFAVGRGKSECRHQRSHLNKKKHRKIHSLLLFCNNKPEI